MSDMVERVARAAFERMLRGVNEMAPMDHVFKDETWDGATPALQDHWREIALAAIAAMREPTEGMVEATAKPYGGFAFPPITAGDATLAWQAMIDAALKE